MNEGLFLRFLYFLCAAAISIAISQLIDDIPWYNRVSVCGIILALFTLMYVFVRAVELSGAR